MIGIIMFFFALGLLAFGFPVAFTFGAVSVVFGIIAGIAEVLPNGSLFEGINVGINMFALMPHRIWSVMNNTIMMAIPLFIFMGIVLQKTKLAERLLESMGMLFGEIRGGLAISTVLVGAFLAASTGVVGASVIAMGVISLPVMLKYNYNKKLATGTICAAGTLGQIIPPSVVLIILGDVFQEPVGDLFQKAIIPGMVLVFFYIIYILIKAFFTKDAAPAIPMDEALGNKRQQIIRALIAIIPPMVLIVLVLGSIFMGIATPTESAAVGGIGAIVLSALYRQFTVKLIMEAAQETVKVTAMVFAILVGATAFSMVFVYTGGDILVEEFMKGLPGEKWGFLFLSMFTIFILGFFIDFIEISYIIIPVLVPIAKAIGLDPQWFAIMIAMNLQTSFLTPPFGFSLFYLKGVAPENVRTIDIYRGVVPFILLQMAVLLLYIFFPQFFGVTFKS